MQQKKTFVILLILSSIPQLLNGLIFDSIISDLALLEKMNAKNRAEFLKHAKDLWYGKDTASISPEESLPITTKKDIIEPSTFDDLPGMPEDIREVIDLLDNAERFVRVGARMPKGILLYGPPGTGKTSAAKVIAKQCNAAFFECSASSFIEIYVGTGPQRIRKLFTDARAHTKAVIFIDEIDAIGGRRGDGIGENSERINTLNELFSQMDGFSSHPGLLVIAATNRIASLDPALIRPGRFDRLIKLDLPTTAVRLAILKRYCSCIAFSGTTAYLETIAKQTERFSGADLKNIIDEAAIFAARENADSVQDTHLEKALQKSRTRRNAQNYIDK